MPLLCTVPGIAWVLAYTIASEIGDITRFATPRKLIEAAHTAARQPAFQTIVVRQRERHGRRRGSAIAAITIARQLAEAIWWMLTRNQPFAPAGAKSA